MSRVITFSRTFPKYHPCKGQPTLFVEGIWSSLNELLPPTSALERLELLGINLENYKPKHHTIRAGFRWKVGGKFSPRVWSGVPYKSMQITIAPDIEIKKIFDFCIDPLGGEYRMDGQVIPYNILKTIAINDGFDNLDDFELWFKLKKGQGFSGQIISWNENINY